MSSSFHNELILKVIDNGLEALGDSSKQAIWSYLESDFNVNRNELPANIRDFHEGIQNIFGLGYKFLDVLFCHYLQKSTGRQFQKSKNFVECVEALCIIKNNSTK